MHVFKMRSDYFAMFFAFAVMVIVMLLITDSYLINERAWFALGLICSINKYYKYSYLKGV